MVTSFCYFFNCHLAVCYFFRFHFFVYVFVAISLLLLLLDCWSVKYEKRKIFASSSFYKVHFARQVLKIEENCYSAWKKIIIFLTSFLKKSLIVLSVIKSEIYIIIFVSSYNNYVYYVL